MPMAIEPKNLEDNELLAYIKLGKSACFAELVKRHNEKFYRLAYRYFNDSDEAEEITQIAFLKLWENPFTYNEGRNAKFTTWFYKVIVNLCLDRLKIVRPSHLEDGHDVSDERQNQEEKVILEQAREHIGKAIAELPVRQRTALNLCFYENLSHKEAAEIMNTNIKAVQSLLMRAKASLKEKLCAYL
ncbi:MAG: polymerase sigma-70 factor family protein [Rickettsiaceae bacterium]|jgi:RNA polymerase sigma-70 factor (ECF subfamily)|nr:polymerase sigma-70 factor family protein [Rickettsiaceae bacterium]